MAALRTARGVFILAAAVAGGLAIGRSYPKALPRLAREATEELISLDDPSATNLLFDFDEFIVGRYDCDINLDWAMVSARQALLRRTRYGVLLVDTESRNGTFVNGSPVVEKILCHGDHVRFGPNGPRFLYLQKGIQGRHSWVSWRS